MKTSIPIDLLEAISKNECILFVASGLSSKVIRSNNKQLPNWKEFMLELLTWAKKNRVPFNSEPDEIKEMIEKGNYLMAAQELQELINPNDFSDFLNEVFRDKDVRPTKSHELLTKISFRAILTTNYDTLLEGAYTISSGGQIPKKYTQNDLIAALSPLRKRSFFILKMHGDIDRPETIILGNRNYSNLLYKSPEYISFLETLFTTHTVLFIGFGGSDPDFDYIIDRLSTIFSRTLNKHFILVPNKKFNFTEKRRLLLDKRLEVIEYDSKNNHEEVETFIEQLYLTANNIESNKVKSIEKDILYFIICTSSDNKKYGKIFDDFFENKIDRKIIGWASFEHFFNVSEPENIKEIFDDDEDNTYIPNKVILLISEDSKKSNRFENEIELALLKELEDQISVIPLIIGNTEVPYKLRNKFVIKLETDFTSEDLHLYSDFF